jgi:predicted aspartyl protease
MAETECGFDDSAGVLGCDLLAAHGPTLLVRIGFDAGYDPTVAQVLPDLPQNPLYALVDTGALESCIDSALAMNLNLPIVDRRMVSGAHGAKEVNVHLAQIHIPALEFIQYGAFCAVDLQAGGQQHQALIGRTFLRNFTMTYEGRTGTVLLHNN